MTFDLLMGRAADRAASRAGFLAVALEIYKNSRNLGDEDLRSALACSPDSLNRLALCLLPNDAEPEYLSKVEAIAQRTGVATDALLKILRESDLLQALTEPAGTGFTFGLMAARDQDPGEF